MPKVITIHEYILKPEADEKQFERAILEARDSGLLKLPGLTAYHFVKGLRGARKGSYTAIWIYESREAWEKVWGKPDNPPSKQDYPENWKIWEDQVLAPFLSQDPDTITFTAYEELS
ncbi:hypothetical protein GWO43_02475 [candidate division KSB1 bacterium]|nr:hypothetical protein [candidate division KSB1 bacterium]NIR69731.1 hypothetical protein [candidate division KSB1 bacterium]NIS22919.1 hypothetical protein [candidate division KSB1 bacterium]NIT69776.1 hypothetical protein [candidate division KSB1 bacterium]NIU23450.1 hypothetical protein [candidate division KSB1 bacterium]